MNVLLVRPPSIMGQEHAHALQHPINLCWLAAFIAPAGFKTTILDYEVRKFTRSDFRDAINRIKPDVVGYTAMTPSIDAVAAMASLARDARPMIVNVIGGPHATILPLETIKAYPQFGAAVHGEGEQAFLEICNAVRENRLGDEPIGSVVSSKDGKPRGDGSTRLPPMEPDSLPLPARELLDLKAYRGAPTPGISGGDFLATQLFTARGCPGKCTFCCSQYIFGRRVRSRSIEHVTREVRDCIDRFGFNHFTIDNDTFTFKRDFVMRFCEELSRLDATWDCDTRVDRVDEEMINAMADSGCRKIAFGVETGSERILKLIRKGTTLDQVRDAFAMTRRAGMLSCAFLMIGNHPLEDESDITRTRRFVSEIKPDLITVAIATPWPRTELYDVMKAEGLLPENLPWSAYGQSFHGKPVTRTHSLAPERLLELQIKMLRGFFLRPAYILRRLASVRSMADVSYWFGAGIEFLKYVFSRKRGAGPDDA